MPLLIFMVLTMDLNGYSQIVKAATTNLVEKEAGENLIITSFTADKKITTGNRNSSDVNSESNRGGNITIQISNKGFIY